MKGRWFVLGAVTLVVVLAGFVSYYASTSPDGLNKIAADQGLATSSPPISATTPLAGYDVTGVGNPRASKAVAGVVGVAVTFAISGGLVVIVRRRRGEVG